MPNIWEISKNYYDFVMYITEKTCCIYVLIKIYLQIKFTTMESYLKCDFKPTPMIFGQEGKNFLESTVHVKKESKHKLAEMEKAYKQFNQAMQRGKND